MPESATAQAAPPDESSYRLPKTVIPERYELTLAPDLSRLHLHRRGAASPSRSSEPVTEILLNAVDDSTSTRRPDQRLRRPPDRHRHDGPGGGAGADRA